MPQDNQKTFVFAVDPRSAIGVAKHDYGLRRHEVVIVCNWSDTRRTHGLRDMTYIVADEKFLSHEMLDYIRMLEDAYGWKRKYRVRAVMSPDEFVLICHSDLPLKAGQVLRVTRLENGGETDLKLEIMTHEEFMGE